MYSHIKISENLEAKLYISDDIAYIGNIKYKNQPFNEIIRLLTICKEQAFKVFHCTHVIGPNDGPTIGVMGGITESEYDLGPLSAYDVSLKDAMIYIGFQPLYDTPRPFYKVNSNNITYSPLLGTTLTKTKLCWKDLTKENCITVSSMWENTLSPKQTMDVMKHYFDTTNCLDYSFKVSDENNTIVMYVIIIRVDDKYIFKQIASSVHHVSIIDVLLEHMKDLNKGKFIWGPCKKPFSNKNIKRYDLSLIGTNQQYMLSKHSNL